MLASPAQAGSVASRVALQTFLGGAGTLESFEGYSIGVSTSGSLSCNPLTSTAICNTQGPGLVVAGISISQSGFVVWNGTGYFGAPSRTIRGYNGSTTGGLLDIAFTNGQRAVGMDLAEISGFPDIATIAFYGPDQTTLLGTIASLALPSSGSVVFAGWEDAGGIGRMTLTGASWEWGPLLDDLEFGTVAAPEPASLALLAGGVALLGWARRRRG